MRVFLVRPSDNGNYGLEAALAGAQRPLEELHAALFRGLRVPLEPLNFAPGDAGFANLGRYDIVLLAGLDPVVLKAEEQLALAAFVERGGGLMLLGGSHSLGNAEGTYLLLERALPARVLRGLDVEVDAMPTPSSHPIGRGLPTPLGYVRKVHPIEPRPEAEVVMRADALPLVVAGEHGYGRVVMVASYPECDETEYGWFFTGDAFDDFFRNAVAWLRKEQAPAWFESFSLPNRQVVTGNEEFGRIKLGSSEPTELQLRTRLTTASGRLVFENVPSHASRITHHSDCVFSFRVPDDPKVRGLHYVAVILADREGRELARRDVAVEVINPTRLAVEFEYGRRALAPGEAAGLRIKTASDLKEPPAELALDLSVLDEDGQPVLAPRRRLVRRRDAAYEELDVSLPLPRLRPGRYHLKAELRVGEGLADVADEELFVVPHAAASDAFLLIADGGYHLDRATTEHAVKQLAEAGVSALSLPGPPLQRVGEMPHRDAMLAYAEERAARAGLGLVHHRRGLLPGLSPAAPLAPCPLTPDFRHALEGQMRPLLTAAARVPGLLFHEAAPRMAVSHAQQCRCHACQAAYKRNLGVDMPAGEPASLDLGQRRELASFVTSYWWHALSAAQKLRDEAAPGVKLSLGFDASAFLRDGPQAPFSDPLVWARAADALEVAPEGDIARYRLSLMGHHAAAAGLGKRLGAQFDIAEDSLPPAEAAYTAIACGASWLRVAENPRFLFASRQPPLPEALGGLFEQLARVAPLLAHSVRPPARAALIFPFTEAAVNGNRNVLAAFELLRAAVGEVDLLHERLATGEGLAPYRLLALLGAEMLPKRVGAALVQFVEQGGLLLADNSELRDEDGQPLAWPEGFFGASETPLFEAITVRRRRFSAGRTMLFSRDIVAAHRRAVETRDPVAQRELARAVQEAAAEQGVHPRARALDPEVELGLRVAGQTWLLVAVNHSDTPIQTRVELDPQAVPTACAFDLAERGGPAHDVAVSLGPRDGGVWALYPERPFTLRLEAPEAIQRHGGAMRYRVLVLNESGQPARGNHIVHVSITDPTGVERPELGGERLSTDGVIEVSEPLAANERLGQWAIAVTDPLTRRVVRRSFEVTGRSGTVD